MSESVWVAVTRDPGSGSARVQVSGEIDLATAADLMVSLTEVEADAAAYEQVYVDLVDVRFLALVGARELGRFAERLRQRGTRVHIECDPARTIGRVLTLCGVALSAPAAQPTLQPGSR